MTCNDMLLGIAVGTLIAALFGSIQWYEDTAETDRIYCEMTEIYINTGGEYGWPDYRGNRYTVCGGGG